MDQDHQQPLNAQTNEEETTSMLSNIEARILGALLEKKQTTPDAYPLTLNSLVTACNQKTSREPVMNLQVGEVQSCLNELETRDLVSIDYGSRADKYQEKLNKSLVFNGAEQAVFCLMLLRGPQTVNELFSRSKRMYDFSSANEVEELLEKHLGKLKPMVFKIPAQAGQREDRYTHTLCGQPEITVTTSSKNSQSQPVNGSDLEQRVKVLEEQVAMLMEKLQ